MKYIIGCLKLLTYYITFLIPRRKKVWLFGGALDKFVGNAKYAFYYVNKEYPKVNAIWLSKDDKLIDFLRKKSYKAYKTTSIRGLVLLLTSKVIINDADLIDFAIPWLTGGAIRVNLWHGVTLKHIGCDVKRKTKESNLDKLLLLYLKLIAPPTYVCTTSPVLLDIFSSAFNISKDKIIVAGYHRTLPFYYSDAELDNLLKQTECLDNIELYRKLKIDTRYKVIYMPTFRDSNPYYFKEAIPNLELLNNVCKEHNILFIIKAHRFTKIDISISTLSNVIVLDKACDVYPLLSTTDLLITDYSSIMFDYVLLNKPIVYYPFDLQEYITDSRELYFPYDTICLPECQVHTFSDLLKMLSNIRSKGILSNNNLRFFENPIDYTSHFSRIKL